ncbi:MAG: acyl-CoA dehydratase activase [Dehalococcoidia bacterium]|jgi:predicted CoA-substrate-specific enzyme activase|nr:acyl-CoA dehydratase activase [Dehalococcoidia bacterium]
MYFVGIDIGSRGAKGAIIESDNGNVKLATSFIGDTGPDSIGTANMVFDNMSKKLGIELKDVAYVIATGYGRVLVPFANGNVSEISCHAKGANYYFPSVRTILDMGGQDCKAINVDENGVVTKFIMNDKCAGGTGRFLEVIGDVLQIPLQEIGPTALKSTQSLPFNTICAVFAKSEAMALAKKGTPKPDILAGLHDAIATRCHNLLKRVSIENDFTITGGISKNTGMVSKLKEKIGLDPVLAPDPQICGALGAAVFAWERYKKKQSKETA